MNSKKTIWPYEAYYEAERNSVQWGQYRTGSYTKSDQPGTQSDSRIIENTSGESTKSDSFLHQFHSVIQIILLLCATKKQ